MHYAVHPAKGVCPRALVSLPVQEVDEEACSRRGCGSRCRGCRGTTGAVDVVAIEKGRGTDGEDRREKRKGSRRPRRRQRRVAACRRWFAPLFSSLLLSPASGPVCSLRATCCVFCMTPCAPSACPYDCWLDSLGRAHAVGIAPAELDLARSCTLLWPDSGTAPHEGVLCRGSGDALLLSQGRTRLFNSVAFATVTSNGRTGHNSDKCSVR